MIELRVTGQRLTRMDYQPVVADSKNYLMVHFSFDSDWEDVGKTAVFTGQNQVFHVLLEQDSCLVPFEVIQAPGFTISVFGGDLITANLVEIPVEASGLAEGQVPAEPTPDIYSQLVEQLSKKADGLLLENGRLWLTAQGVAIGPSVVLPQGQGETPVPQRYVCDFLPDQFTEQEGRYQLAIPQEQHQMGTSGAVIELTRQAELGFENVAIQYRRQSNGDILVYAYQPFAGRIVIEGV